MLAANHTSNFDPWPLGLPLWPNRQLRFMAKSELFWWPMRAADHGRRRLSGATRRAATSRRSRPRSSSRARGRWSRCSREGTRARKGLRKKYQRAAAHGRGADRARGGRPARPGGDRRHRPPDAARSAARRATARRSRSTTSRRATRHEAARIATERLMVRDRRAGGGAVTQPLLVDRRRLARAPRVPRAAEVDPARRAAARQRARRLHEHARRGCGRPSSRGPCSSAGTRSTSPTYRHEVFAAYQGGREFDAELLEQLDLLPQLVEAFGFAVAKAAGLRGRRLPRRRGRAEEARGGTASSRPPTGTRSSSRASATTILQPTPRRERARAVGPGGGARALRRRARAGARLHRAARRPVGQAPRRAGRRPEEGRADLLRQYGTLEAALEAGRFAPQAEEFAALPTNRDAGRLRSPTSPDRPEAAMGGGVFLSWAVGPAGALGTARRTRLSLAAFTPGVTSESTRGSLADEGP